MVKILFSRMRVKFRFLSLSEGEKMDATSQERRVQIHNLDETILSRRQEVRFAPVTARGGPVFHCHGANRCGFSPVRRQSLRFSRGG